MLNIVRPQQGRVLAGVCAGIANRYGWRHRTVRRIFLLSCLLPGPQFLLYIAAWKLLPEEKTNATVIDIEDIVRRAA